MKLFKYYKKSIKIKINWWIKGIVLITFINKSKSKAIQILLKSKEVNQWVI